MNARTREKINQIEKFVEELAKIRPTTFKQYSTDLKTKAACERYFEKILEAVVDLAFLVIREKELQMPEDDKQAFDILANAKSIAPSLAVRLKEAKGMRNFLAHQYGMINDKLVFRAISQELEKDVRAFLQALEKP